MIKELYEDIIEALRGSEEIKHIDLWNQNVEFIEQDTPFPMPALFVEFGEINWRSVTGRSEVREWQGKGTLVLHIVTEWKGSSASDSPDRESSMKYLKIGERIQRIMEDLRGIHYGNIHLSRTLTNHDHEDVVESIEVYNVEFERRIPDNSG